MLLTSTQQVLSDDLKNIDFDIFVGASGFEKRAAHSLQFLNLSRIEQKLVFGFEDRINQQRSLNDHIYENFGFLRINTDGDGGPTLRATILNAIESSQKDSVRILIDYSSMTRSWYAAIISTIRSISTKKSIECYFGYSPSVFESPKSTAPNQSVSPIPGFGGLDAIDRPTALVVGMGYEKDRALGLLEYVDPAACFAFIADPPLDNRYLETVIKNNASFLKLIKTENQYRHPLIDLQQTCNLLLSLVWGLRDQYRVILAPLGVKPVSLICLLVAVNHPDVDVWRVTSGTKACTQVREPLGPFLVLRAIFE